jgi:hypothetical protein
MSGRVIASRKRSPPKPRLAKRSESPSRNAARRASAERWLRIAPLFSARPDRFHAHEVARDGEAGDALAAVRERHGKPEGAAVHGEQRFERLALPVERLAAAQAQLLALHEAPEEFDLGLGERLRHAQLAQAATLALDLLRPGQGRFRTGWLALSQSL